MKVFDAVTPACAIALSLPGVPTTPTSHPGICACNALSATCRWRPDRSSRTRLRRGIDHLRRPPFENEQRPHAAPDPVVAAVEAIEEILRHLRIEHATTADSIWRQRLAHDRLEAAAHPRGVRQTEAHLRQEQHLVRQQI